MCRPVRSMFFQKLPKLVLFESLAGSVCRGGTVQGVVSRVLLNLVCTVGQVTICQYLCGDSKAMHGGGRGEQEVLVELWVRAGTLQTELLLCACTEEAEEPVQSCVCSCWVSIFPVFPFWDAWMSRPREWWLSSQAVSVPWALGALSVTVFWLNRFLHLQKAKEFQDLWDCKCVGKYLECCVVRSVHSYVQKNSACWQKILYKDTHKVAALSVLVFWNELLNFDNFQTFFLLPYTYPVFNAVPQKYDCLACLLFGVWWQQCINCAFVLAAMLHQHKIVLQILKL